MIDCRSRSASRQITIDTVHREDSCCCCCCCVNKTKISISTSLQAQDALNKSETSKNVYGKINKKLGYRKETVRLLHNIEIRILH